MFNSPFIPNANLHRPLSASNHRCDRLKRETGMKSAGLSNRPLITWPDVNRRVSPIDRSVFTRDQIRSESESLARRTNAVNSHPTPITQFDDANSQNRIAWTEVE